MEKVLTKTVKLSSKGQLVLPMALRRNLNLRDGDELSLELNDSNEIILRKLPSALDWSNLIADIPNEVVDVDTEGNYDPKKAPRIANVPFDGSDKSKVRPALVVKIKDNYVSVFKITSQYENKSEKIKRAYYPIKNWEIAGLNRISYVDTLQTYDIDKATIFKNRPIGKLTKEDVSGLYQFLQAKRS